MPFEKGMLVRVRPAATVRGKLRHFGRAIVVSVSRYTAVIKPLGKHRKTEEVKLTALRLWKAKQNDSDS